LSAKRDTTGQDVHPDRTPAGVPENAANPAPLPGCVAVLPRNRWYRASRSTTGYSPQRLRRWLQRLLVLGPESWAL